MSIPGFGHMLHTTHRTNLFPSDAEISVVSVGNSEHRTIPNPHEHSKTAHIKIIIVF